MKYLGEVLNDKDIATKEYVDAHGGSGEENVQSDWLESDSDSDAYIKNKPELAVIPIGKIDMYAGSTAPSKWRICDGSAISRTTYAALYNVIGTTYGSGDGSTTFNLPNFKGRVPIGVGNGDATGHTNHALASKGGNENAITPYHRHSYSAPPANTGDFTLQSTHMPSHTHVQNQHRHTAPNQLKDTAGTAWAPATTKGTTTTVYTGYSTPTNQNTGGGTAHKHSITASSSNTGYAGTDGNATGANMQPYLTVNFIIYCGQ